jgi:hypothetical protein
VIVEDNITAKYHLKMICDQFGRAVPEDFYDTTETICIHQFERLCLELKRQERDHYTMIELGSNQAYYSTLFRAIIDGVGNNTRCRNIMVEPTDECIVRGRNHFALNGFDGIFTDQCIGHYWCWGTRWHDPSKQSVTIDDLLREYDLDELDVLHADIDGNEIKLLETATDAFRQQKIRNILLLTHGIWDEKDQATQIIKAGENRHDVCKAILTGYGYVLEHEESESVVGSDGLLVFRAA